MPRRLFTFVQMELAWELGPADGRYLLRRPAGSDGGEPQHVLVLSTVGAERRRLLGGRARTRRARKDPVTVPVARATVIDAVALSAESQARAWLSSLDPEREAQQAATALNRLLYAHRVACAGAYVHEISPTQALAIRAGFGEGEQVAEGTWIDARELLLGRRSAQRRAAVLRPQERLAGLLSGKGTPALLCEELALRARADLDQGRIRHAAVELERAYAAALSELRGERGAHLLVRSEELDRLRPDVERAAQLALAADQDQVDSASMERALARLEAALRARAAGA